LKKVKLGCKCSDTSGKVIRTDASLDASTPDITDVVGDSRVDNVAFGENLRNLLEW
jgi:hypothetical protein